MTTMRLSLPFALILTLPPGPVAHAAAGPSAMVKKVFGRASAPANSALPPGQTFTTQSRSRSELAVRGSVVRVGANADLQTEAKGLLLRQGISLVANPPGSLRKSLEVRTPGYHLKVRGTVQVAVVPGRSMKIVVLEGTATVALDSVWGEFETLRPGQMLVINPSDQRLPDPVDVDLQHLSATSALVAGEFGPLPTASNIVRAAENQTRSFSDGDLARTPFLIRGSDSLLEVEKVRQARAESRQDQRRVVAGPSVAGVTERTLFEAVNDLDDPLAITPSRPFVFETGAIAANAVGGRTFARDERNRSRTRELAVELKPATRPFDSSVEDSPLVGYEAPRIFGNVTVDKGFFGSAPQTLKLFSITAADPYSTLAIEPGANVYTPRGVGLSVAAKYGLDITAAKLTAGVGTAELLSIGASEGDVQISRGSTLTGGKLLLAGASIQSRTVTVDTSKITARSGVAVSMETTPSTLRIHNSSEIVALLAAVDLLVKRGEISIESSTIAAKGKLQIDAMLAEMDENRQPITTRGLVTLRDVQLNARAIRVRGYADGGDALIVDGSTFNAAQLIKLYAEGASTLRFRNTVSLNTAVAILAGKTVEVDPGGVVTITGKGRVFTDNPHFNTPGFVTSPGHGKIEAEKGLTLKGLADAVPFKR